MNSNIADSLVDYGDNIKSQIEAGGVTHAEHGDAHDRTCAVLQSEKSAREVFVVDATNDATKFREPVTSRDRKLESREPISGDRSAAGATTNIHPGDSAEPISFGEYMYAVMMQLCYHEACDATSERASEELALMYVHNSIPLGAVSEISYFNDAENFSLVLTYLAPEPPTGRMVLTSSQSAKENLQMQAAMADPDPRSESQTISVVEYRDSSM